MTESQTVLQWCSTLCLPITPPASAPTTVPVTRCGCFVGASLDTATSEQTWRTHRLCPYGNELRSAIAVSAPVLASACDGPQP